MKSKNSILVKNLILSCLTFFFLFEALKPYLSFPLNDNEGAFILIGREMARGARLYADIWDHKPPFLFGQSWLIQIFFPLTERGLDVYGFCIHAFNAFMIFQLAKQMGFSRAGAWASALIYPLLLFSPLFQVWAVDADMLIQPFLLLSFWAVFSKNRWMNFLSGIFWAAAFFTKQTALFLLPVYLMAGAFSDIPKIIKWAAGAILLSVVVILPFALDGRWVDFYSSLIVFNQYYVEKGWLFFFAVKDFRDFLIQWTRMAVLVYGLPFLTLGLGWVGSYRNTLHSRTFLFLGFWLFTRLMTGCISGYFFTYYFIGLLPPLSLGLGLAWMNFKETKRKDLAVCFFAMAIGVVMISANQLGLRDNMMAYAQYPFPRYYADKAMGYFIASKAKPTDKLLCWADDPQIYVYSGLSPAIRTPFINHLSALPFMAWQTYKEFTATPPRFCVVCRMDQVIAPPDWFKKGLAKKYLKVKTFGDLDLYEFR